MGQNSVAPPEQQVGPSARYDDETEAFIRLDFESQREMRAALNSLVASETNILLAIVGATFLGLAFMGDFVGNESAVEDGHLVLGIALGVLTIDLLIGIAMYLRMVSSRITVVKYARYMNRARNYFVTRNGGEDSLGRYVSSDIYDNLPPFGAVGTNLPGSGVIQGNTGMIAILNSGSFAAIIGVGSRLIFGGTNTVLTIGGLEISWWALGVVAGFLSSLTVHHKYQHAQYAEEEKRWIAFHPKPLPSIQRHKFTGDKWFTFVTEQLNRIRRPRL